MFNQNDLWPGRPGEIVTFAGFAGLFQVTEEASNTPWWLIIVITVVVLLLLFAPELRRRGQARSASTTSAAEPDIAAGGEAAPQEGVAAPAFATEPTEAQIAPSPIEEADAAPPATAEATAPTAAAEPSASVAEAAPPKPDNLTQIEGIGPKIAGLLQEANITTFDQLAATEVSRLEEILEAANLHMVDPTSWPEQASLAASEEWEALESLKGLLKGGRRA